MSELRPTIDLGFSSVKLNIDLIKCATSPKAFALMVSDIREKKGDQLCAPENTGDQPLDLAISDTVLISELGAKQNS